MYSKKSLFIILIIIGLCLQYFGLICKANWIGMDGTGSTSTAQIENYIRGSDFICQEYGLMTNISVLLGNTDLSNWTGKVKGAVYNYYGDTFICNTEERTLTLIKSNGNRGWFTFNITSTNYVIDGGRYIIVVWSELKVGNLDVNYYNYQVGHRFGKSLTYTTNFPSSITWTSNTSTVSHWIKLNYNSKITIYENIVNATGTHEYFENETGFHIWANYTGNTTPISLYENIVNATGTHEYSLNSSGYHVWANYTGNNTIDYTKPLSPVNFYAKVLGNMTYNYIQLIWEANPDVNFSQPDTYFCREYVMLPFDVTNQTYTNISLPYDWNNIFNYSGDNLTKIFITGMINDSMKIDNKSVLCYNDTGWLIPLTNGYVYYYEIRSYNSTYNTYSDWIGTATHYALPIGIVDGWDMVSIPRNLSVPVADIYVINATNNFTWNEAVSNGVIINWVYGWNYVTQNYEWATTFEGYRGYWMFYYIDGYHLWYPEVAEGTTSITLYENIVNATGTHEYSLNSSGYHVWANYTGTGGNGSSIGMVFLNKDNFSIGFSTGSLLFFTVGIIINKKRRKKRNYD